MGFTPSVAKSALFGPRRILSQILAAALVTAGFTVAVAGAAGADGNTLYASPSGSGDCSSPSDSCSLATALADASNGDSIWLLAGSYAGTSYTIATSVNIQPAPGVSNLVLSDDADVSVFTVDAGVTATLEGLDLTTGFSGMGILNNGTLTVENCIIYDNFGGDGGGIENLAEGFLNVVSSSIYGNSAASGAGIFNNEGVMNVQDSTISENYSYSGGGGIVNILGTSTIESSTIGPNSAQYGSGIDNVSGTTTLAATIVAGNPSDECLGTVSDGGYNIDDDGSCGFSAPGSVSDSPAIDDYLGTLDTYGGPTPTVPLLSLPSPATSAPDPALGVIPGTFDLPDGGAACSGTDQRGVARPAPCDIGAFELQETDLTLSASPTSLSPGGSVTYTATVSPVPDGGRVTFSDGVANPATVHCASEPVSVGVARCTVSYPDAASYSVSATYSGDTDFASSNAGPITQSAGTAEPTSSLLTLSRTTVVYGSENLEDITALVIGQAGAGDVKGTMVVTIGGVKVCTITLIPAVESTGTCLLGATALPAGVLPVSGHYVPAAVSSTNALYYYTASTYVSTENLTVQKDYTTTSVSVSPTKVSVGAEQQAIFSVSVRSLNRANVPNGETATVSIGSGGVHCIAKLTNGAGTCTIGGSQIPCTATGNATAYPVSAAYPGDSDFVASTSNNSELVVVPAPKAPKCP